MKLAFLMRILHMRSEMQRKQHLFIYLFLIFRYPHCLASSASSLHLYTRSALKIF